MGGRGGQPDNDAEKREEKGRGNMKGKEGGKERKSQTRVCKPRRCPGDLAQKVKPPAAGI